MRRILEAIGIFLLLLTGCAGGSGTTGLLVGNEDSARQTLGFSLRLLDDGSGTACQPAEAWLAPRVATDGTVTVDVHISGAEGLNALYCAVDYDADCFAPVSASAGRLLGDQGEILELAVLSEPGTAYLGQVRMSLGGVTAPLSGDGVAARFVFEEGESGVAMRRASAIQQAELEQFTLEADVDIVSTFTDYLYWYFCNPGDFDQNGEVSITDIAALAPVFGAVSSGDSFPYYSIESVVDGDNNGEINQGDMALIAQNFGNKITGFALFASPDEADVPADGSIANGSGSETVSVVAINEFEQATKSGRHQFRYYEPSRYGETYWVRLAGENSELGSVSSTVHKSELTPPTSSHPGTYLQIASSTSLSWLYSNLGDFDQDGIVKSKDAQMLTDYYMQSVQWPANDLRSTLDADQNGEINIADIPQMALNLGHAVEGYNIYASADPEDYPNSASEVSVLTPFATVPFPEPAQIPDASEHQRIVFVVEIPLAQQGLYYWVRPYYGELEGIASELAGGSG